MSDSDSNDELSRRYRRASTEEPPAALDREILGAAAAATAAAAARRRRRRWRLPGPAAVNGPIIGLATAAVMVLAVTLVLQSPEQASVSLEAAPASADRDAARETSADERRSAGTATAQQRLSSAKQSAAPAPRPAAPEAAGALLIADPDSEELLISGTRAPDATANSADAPAARSDPAAFADPAVFRDPGCTEPFPLPDGAILRLAERGLQVSVAGETYILRCVDGAWVQAES